MKPPATALHQDDLTDALSAGTMAGFLDAKWYLERYPDIAASNLDPHQHYIRHGAAERRDPNAFFDNAWYVEHYPDVAASGLNPLLHYVQSGAAELRNPHPRFDAAYYVDQHPDAAANPLLYHLRVGIARGYLTERTIDINDYLPSQGRPLPIPIGVFADVVILIQPGQRDARTCIRSVLADRTFPLARIIVVDDHGADPTVAAWLEELATEGQIHLIRNRRPLGFTAAANLGAEAAIGHDVVLLRAESEVPPGWLRRLAAQAYAQPNIATVSPLSDAASIRGCPDDAAVPRAESGTLRRIDSLCQAINVGRSGAAHDPVDHCIYIRRAALLALGPFDADRSPQGTADLGEFCARAMDAGWRHRIACDTFVGGNRLASAGRRPQRRCLVPASVLPFQFAVTAALFRESKLPVILMVTHRLGGGVRRHINGLVERYRDRARVLLLEATDRGASLSLSAGKGVLTLPADRLDDLVTVLRSTQVSRIHIHHLLQMDMDVRTLIHRLGVPFDVTVHDYFAICPRINLLRWSEGIYCGEPGPAACNACIAEQSSHGARDITAWRRDHAWQFLEADRVICPSTDVKTRLDRYALGQRAVVVPHEHQTDVVWTTRIPAFSEPPLRVVLLGVLANHKGARTVAALAEAVAPGTVELYLIGHLERNFPKPAVKFIKVTGEYQDADLPELVRAIDPHLVWFPSPWPETYSYTLSAAIKTGLPIVAADIGSFSERLAGRPLSWLVDYRASTEDWLAVFDQVRATLRKRGTAPQAARIPAGPDFYSESYLSPPPRKTAGARRRRIVIVPERYRNDGLTPCAYIRLLQPLDHLAADGEFDVMLADVETIFECEAEIIVTQRCAIPDLDTVARLTDHCRRTGARLLYDLDDDLVNIPDSHPDAPMLQPFAKVVRRMLSAANMVWVSTAALAERLAPVRPDSVVIENRLDERIWIHRPVAPSLWDHPVRILCMGTSTHERDFAMIEPVLRRLKAEYQERIVIDVLGMTTRSELPAELNRIGPSTQASRSYPGFVHWLTSTQPGWHIGLAPLLDTPFNRSKSPIKAMDYAAMGLAVLASDTPAYRGSIADGPAGQLVANTEPAWHAALDWLIRNPAVREQTAAQAREAFLAQATLASDTRVRLAALTKLLRQQTAGAAVGLRESRPTLSIPHEPSGPTTRKRRHSGGGR